MYTIYPQKAEYLDLAGQYNLIPLYAELPGDLHTAISLFLKMRKGRYQFLLESAVSGEHMGRYSFMGNSESAITCKDNKVSLIQEGEVTEEKIYDNPLDYVRTFFQQIEAYEGHGLPPFANGVVGFFGYDSIRYFEDVKLADKDLLENNDFDLIIAGTMVIYDNLSHRLFVVHSPFLKGGDDVGARYDEACKKIEALIETLKGKEELPEPFSVERDQGRLAYKSNFSKERFEGAVDTVKDHIRAGDIFQLVLAQRLRIPVSGDTFNLYRSLRIVNPSPYMFYLKCNDVEVIGSSPEVHVQLQDGKVNIRPIAGTRPRGKNSEEDHFNEEELRSDEKELA